MSKQSKLQPRNLAILALLLAMEIILSRGNPFPGRRVFPWLHCNSISDGLSLRPFFAPQSGNSLAGSLCSGNYCGCLKSVCEHYLDSDDHGKSLFSVITDADC